MRGMARSGVPIASGGVGLAAALLLLLPAGPAAAAGEIHVQGRVVAESGEPMAGWPVLLIATQRYIEFSRYSSGGAVLTIARTTTDASGYYAFDVKRERGYQFWFVRFVEAGQLDVVRYLPPADVEITADVRRGRVASVQQTIRTHPDWAEVERKIADAGGAQSPKGQVLRTLGLPEKTDRDDVSGDDEWWYFTKGVVYTFRGQEATGLRRFEPVKPPGGGAQPPSGETRPS